MNYSFLQQFIKILLVTFTIFLIFILDNLISLLELNLISSTILNAIYLTAFTLVYFYLKYRRENLVNFQFIFFTFYILVSYLHLNSGTEWFYSPISNLFTEGSILIGIGHILKIPFMEIINFVFIFGFIILDFLILRIIIVMIEKLLHLNKKLMKDLKINKQILKGIKFKSRVKIKSFLIILIIFMTSTVYFQALEELDETNEGIAYILEGISLILSSNVQNEKLDFNSMLKDPTKLLSLKNNFYKAGDYFYKAEIKLKRSSQLGISEFPTILEFIKELGNFSKNTVIFVIAIFEDYIFLMNKISKELLRRAYWWELERLNISYDPKKDFYNKFENKINDRIIDGSEILNDHIEKLKSIIKGTSLFENDLISKFMFELDKLNMMFIDLTFLTSLGPPLLNATFASIEITNALAFDQFVTARTLNQRAKIYYDKANDFLNQYSFNEKFDSIVIDIVNILSQFNKINFEFANMTIATESMFLNISRNINILNSTSILTILDPLEQDNNKINDSINFTADVVQRNLKLTMNFSLQDFTGIKLPFKPIFEHFLWFYSGYKSAVDGYRNLWFSSDMTIDLFDNTNQLLEDLDNTMQNINTSILNVNSIPIIKLNNDFENYKRKIIETADTLVYAVTVGAIKTNETLWSNLLGYNNTQLINETLSFYEFYIQFKEFMLYVEDNNLFSNSTAFLEYYNTWKSNISFVYTLTGNSIFLNLSEELVSNI